MKGISTLLQSQNVYKMFFNSTDNCKNFEKYIIIDNIDYLQNNDKKMIGIFIKFLNKNIPINMIMFILFYRFKS